MTNPSYSGRQVFPRGKSKSDHRTPINFFKKFDKEFDFTLDVATNNDNYLVDNYYSIDNGQDGLNLPWGGRVWCNPPYNDMKTWVEKAIFEIKNNQECEVVVMLLPARISTKWFKIAWDNANEIRFITGRLIFGGPHQVGKNASAPFPSVVIIFTKVWHLEPVVKLIERD